METQGLNLFIVDDNKSMVEALKQFIKNKFGTSINISTFSDGEGCLRNVNNDTHVVILDHFLNGKNGLETLKLIKEINPKTEVIMLTSNDDIITAIQSFREGAKDYIVKGPSAWRKVTQLLTMIITEPIRLLVKEFGVSKYMAIFLLTFLSMGAVVCFFLNVI